MKILMMLFCLLPMLMMAEESISNEKPPFEKGENPPTMINQSAVIDEAPVLTIIEEALALIRKAEIDKAYTELTALDFRKATSLEQFKAFVSSQPTLAKNKSFQSHSFYLEDGVATSQGTLTSTEGKEAQVEFDLVKEEEKWKILGLQLFKSETAGFTSQILNQK